MLYLDSNLDFNWTLFPKKTLYNQCQEQFKIKINQYIIMTRNKNCTELNMNSAKDVTMMKHCRFCEGKVAEIKQFQADEILYESDKFYAISSIGGFIPGWTLVFPKEHNLNMSVFYGNQDLHFFLSDVHKAVAEIYGTSVIFEHGSNNETSQTACGVAHAHIHIVPFNQNIELLAKDASPDLVWTKADLNSIDKISEGNEYLFCANKYSGTDTKGCLAILNNPQSQFFRKVLAKAVGLVDLYDYKKYRFEDISTDTTKKLTQHFTALENTQ